ncbi:hypothetical protein GCM10011399_31680 [Subtercola lobariae]|uniref:Uncharacterized protein n=1 Tax=Subtercola lobariae TaxID=1588641 RepID=A0A917BD30_9MICO|nr:hypothetical protein GCM10011399_31680 [Subtercola lobariae]
MGGSGGASEAASAVGSNGAGCIRGNGSMGGRTVAGNAASAALSRSIGALSGALPAESRVLPAIR